MATNKKTDAPTAPQDPLLAGGVTTPGPAGPSALVAASLMGAVFGFAIQKGRVYEPRVIVDQLAGARFAMLKMFMAAAATSIFITSLMTLTRFGRSRVAGARKWAYNNYRGPIAATIGGLILGVGMALSGACPGTGPVQVGAGVAAALYTVAGGLAGAAAFGFIEPGVLQPTGILKACGFAKPTFDLLLGAPFAVVGFAFVAVMAVASVMLESAFPWRKDVGLGDSVDVASLAAYAWPPWFTGVIVGSLQLFGLVFVRDTIGSSRAYVTAVVQAGRRVFRKCFDDNSYFCGCACGVGNYQQLIYLVSSIGGAWLSAHLSGSFGAVQGFGALRSFVGGFLTVFGGRFAGGCTSGQGISGNAVLGLISPIATIAMFVGGIATTLLL